MQLSLVAEVAFAAAAFAAAASGVHLEAAAPHDAAEVHRGVPGPSSSIAAAAALVFHGHRSPVLHRKALAAPGGSGGSGGGGGVAPLDVFLLLALLPVVGGGECC